MWHPVDTFVPGRLHTVCKKQVNHGPSESETYQALMEDPVHEVVPRFYREFQQDEEGLLGLLVTVSYSSTFLQLLLVTARCYADAVMRLQVVCLSITFRYLDHIGWNFSKIISSWPNNLRSLLTLTLTWATWLTFCLGVLLLRFLILPLFYKYFWFLIRSHILFSR